MRKDIKSLLRTHLRVFFYNWKESLFLDICHQRNVSFITEPRHSCDSSTALLLLILSTNTRQEADLCRTAATQHDFFSSERSLEINGGRGLLARTRSRSCSSSGSPGRRVRLSWRRVRLTEIFSCRLWETVTTDCPTRSCRGWCGVTCSAPVWTLWARRTTTSSLISQRSSLTWTPSIRSHGWRNTSNIDISNC